MNLPAVRVAPARSRGELRRFLNLPWRLYAGDPCWVPPLRSQVAGLLNRRHPFYAEGENDREVFLAWRGGRPVGRVVAIQNSVHNRFHDDRWGFFGFFECEDDLAVAQALLEAAADWLRSKGCDLMVGPVNPSTNYEVGLLVAGFDLPPAVMMPYNPPRYRELLEESGFAKARDLLAYRSSVHPGSLDRLEKLAGRTRAREPELTTRPVELCRLETEVELLLSIYNRAWEDNWGFVPASERELFYLANEVKSFLDPELFRIATLAGEPVGFLLALPDVNPALAILDGSAANPLRLARAYFAGRRRYGLRLLTLGVVDGFRLRGIEGVLFYEGLRAALERGYRWCEYSWILEENELAKRTVRLMDARESQRYRIFTRSI